MKLANDIRLELVAKQRMDSTRQKWLNWCERFDDKPLVTGCNNLSVGEKIDFVRTRSSGRGCYTMTKCKGVIFAFNSLGTVMIVVCNGKLETVNNDECAE